jgi:hypothetical protein
MLLVSNNTASADQHIYFFALARNLLDFMIAMITEYLCRILMHTANYTLLSSPVRLFLFPFGFLFRSQMAGWFRTWCFDYSREIFGFQFGFFFVRLFGRFGTCSFRFFFLVGNIFELRKLDSRFLRCFAFSCIVVSSDFGQLIAIFCFTFFVCKNHNTTTQVVVFFSSLCL